MGAGPSRPSPALICETGAFVVNLVQQEQLDQVEYCGFLSGREADKFAGADLTRASGSAVQTPIIVEWPINLECRVRHHLPLGSHDLFVGVLVGVEVHRSNLDQNLGVD